MATHALTIRQAADRLGVTYRYITGGELRLTDEDSMFV